MSQYVLADEYTQDGTGAVIRYNPDGSITSSGLPSAPLDPNQYYPENNPAPEPSALPSVEEAKVKAVSFLHGDIGRAILSGIAANVACKFFGVEGNMKTGLVAAAAWSGYRGVVDPISIILPP